MARGTEGGGGAVTVEMEQLVVAGLAGELLGVLDGLLEFCVQSHGGRAVEEVVGEACRV